MMELQKAMIDDLKITPSTCFANNNDDVYNGFSAGNYATMTSSGARIVTHRKNATFDPMDIQLMTFPKINGKNPRTISGGWCIGVSSKSKYKYEAGKFVEFLWAKETDWMFCSEAGQVPSRKSTYAEHPEFFKKPENQYLLVLQECMDNHIIPIPSFQFVGTKEDLIGAFTNYYLEGMPAMGALQKAEKDFNERNK
jgi:ABC-type glycerol-3-phosphate transport system substrate-binding protein